MHLTSIAGRFEIATILSSSDSSAACAFAEIGADWSSANVHYARLRLGVAAGSSVRFTGVAAQQSANYTRKELSIIAFELVAR